MTFATRRPQHLYPLLPAVYRITDAELGHPLQALMEVLEWPYHAIETDILEMYDDWFVETCAPGLVPYIGDLVGVPRELDPDGAIPTIRVRVADALAYARRKGPAWVLAQAAGDVTGWPARAVEMFRFLSQTQDVADVRSRLGRTADLRFGAAVEAGTPFDPMARTVEVRGADSNGRWAADRVTLYLWRLASYPLTASQPRGLGSGRFTVCPFGADTQLFLPPRTAPPFGAERGPWDVPGPVSRELLVRVVEEMEYPDDPWSAGEYPVLAVLAGADASLAAPCALVPADLAEWRLPEGVDPRGNGRGTPLRAAVDPRLGRIAFLDGADPGYVRVDWSYGFSASLGGGPYARAADVPAPGPGAFVAQVGGVAEPDPNAARAPDLATALALCAGTPHAEAVVVLADSAVHAVPAGWVTMAPGRRLWVVAGAGERPCLSGPLSVRGTGGSGLVLDGLLVDGTVWLDGDLDVTVRDCTLSPHVPGAAGEARRSVATRSNFVGMVTVTRSLLGPLAMPLHAAGVSLSDSIVAGEVYAVAAGDDAEGGASAELTVERCTVFGVVQASTLHASDSIFVHLVLAGAGELTCCYVPPGSQVPHCDRCLPSAAHPHARPRFTAVRYGDPAFAQLSAATPLSIRTGASNGGEMGAFHLLDTPRRVANLRLAIDEFLPQDLEALFTYVT